MKEKVLIGLGVAGGIAVVCIIFFLAYLHGQAKNDAIEKAQDHSDIACQVTIRHGHKGDITTDYYASELGDQCDKLIQYTDELPSDTPIYQTNVAL